MTSVREDSAGLRRGDPLGNLNPRRFSLFVFVLFLTYLVIGLRIVPDYGISTDEVDEDVRAGRTIDYVLGRNEKLLTYADRHYGAVLSIIFKLVGGFFPDSRDNYLVRHYITFLIFYFSTIVFYRLLRTSGYNQPLSLLGTAILVLHPHIFSHSFYNPKDIPFLSIFVANLYTLHRLVRKRTHKLAILHGFFSGLLVVFRLPGILMWAITLLIGAWVVLTEPEARTKTIQLWLTYILLAVATVYALLPVLWLDPIGQARVFLSMKLFTWEGKELFMGRFLSVRELPWYHIPVYIAVTTPPLYLVLFALGNAFILWDLCRGQLLAPEALHKWIAVAAFWFSMAAILIRDPVVYNGWRHVFFLYPLMVLFMVAAIQRLWESKAAVIGGRGSDPVRIGAVLLIGYQLVSVAAFMVDSHPYEHVYYNRLAGRTLADARLQYVMDYWGLSYKQALENLLRLDDSRTIRVNGPPGTRHDFSRDLLENYKFLKRKERKRIEVVSIGEAADYYITDFYKSLAAEIPGTTMVSSIQVRGALISATYRYEH